MKKILLLNPPSKEYFIRDYYCSHISKGKYYWPPLDLLILSGIFRNYFQVQALDAISQNLDYTRVHNFIRKMKPDYIVSVTGAVSWEEDMLFLSQIKRTSNLSIILSGDYPLAQPRQVMKKYPFIDAILLDFTDSDIIEFIAGGKVRFLKNMLTRFDTDRLNLVTESNFSIPVPHHDIFPLRSYHLPHIYYHPFATIMTDFGCPFNCTFCPFERIGYKLRTIDNIVDELEYIRCLKIKELWLRDQSFGSSRDHALRFCKALKSLGRRFSWSCEMRVDAADEEILVRMKENGCHTVMFGVETANPDVLQAVNKGVTIRQIEDAFRLAKKSGLRILAHFILGLPGETAETQKSILDFCLKLDPDLVSFNIAAPLWNTSFRDEVVDKKWLLEDSIEVDSSSSYPVWERSSLSRSAVWQARALALRKFYLRPSYILKQAINIRTAYQLYSLFREGLHFIPNNKYK